MGKADVKETDPVPPVPAFIVYTSCNGFAFASVKFNDEVGLLLVLHTWGQALSYHPHAHGVATGGGLTPDGRWRSSCWTGTTPSTSRER